MPDLIAMLMLPVEDLAAAAGFYARTLGWTSRPIGPNALGMVGDGPMIVLIERAYLEQESGIDGAAAGPGPVGVVAVAGRAEVNAVQAKVGAAGGRISSGARERDFGIYSFYFADPDGNGWEVLWSPPHDQS